MKEPFSTSTSIRMVPLLFVILFAGATLANSELCPPAVDISPCVCHGNQTITDVVCSNITSHDDLMFILAGGHFRDTIPHLVLQKLPFSTLPFLAGPELRVRDLEILDGNISHFSRNAIRYQPLSSLRVDRNRLADVPSEALLVVRRTMKILSMSGNALKKLGPTSLSVMDAVEKLTLSENEISQVARDFFPAKVRYLWISRNKLTTFNGSLLSLYRLMHLDASYNNLTTMKGEFHGLYSLQTVILDHNHISDISGTFLHLYSVGRSSIRELSLVGNGIREIGEALVELEQLTHLNLSRNAITNLSPTVFEKMINLYDLNLSENPLTAFQICPALTSLSLLRVVNLSNSNLLTLPWNCFDNNTSLEYMDLSRNKLPNLRLLYVTNLLNLDISFNNFKFVHNLELPRAGYATLILEGNPWVCSKETTFDLKDLDESGYYFPSGYPTCFKNGEKPGRCLVYRYHMY